MIDIRHKKKKKHVYRRYLLTWIIDSLIYDNLGYMIDLSEPYFTSHTIPLNRVFSYQNRCHSYQVGPSFNWVLGYCIDECLGYRKRVRKTKGLDRTWCVKVLEQAHHDWLFEPHGL